jgi:hypothetical protein
MRCGDCGWVAALDRECACPDSVHYRREVVLNGVCGEWAARPRRRRVARASCLDCVHRHGGLCGSMNGLFVGRAVGRADWCGAFREYRAS